LSKFLSITGAGNTIYASHYTVWPDINWQAGVYDVVFKGSDRNNATRFILTRSTYGA